MGQYIDKRNGEIRTNCFDHKTFDMDIIEGDGEVLTYVMDYTQFDMLAEEVSRERKANQKADITVKELEDLLAEKTRLINENRKLKPAVRIDYYRNNFPFLTHL